MSYRTSNISWSQLQTSRDDLVAALFYAQQLSMARDSAGNPITFVATNSSTIRVQESAADVGNDYPVTFARGVVLTAPVAFPFTLTYDKLGRTNATTFTLSGGGNSVDVVVSGSGYAR